MTKITNNGLRAIQYTYAPFGVLLGAHVHKQHTQPNSSSQLQASQLTLIVNHSSLDKGVSQPLSSQGLRWSGKVVTASCRHFVVCLVIGLRLDNSTGL